MPYYFFGDTKMVKFQITLEEKTFKALQALSKIERREPKHQAVVLIQDALKENEQSLVGESETRGVKDVAK